MEENFWSEPALDGVDEAVHVSFENMNWLDAFLLKLWLFSTVAVIFGNNFREVALNVLLGWNNVRAVVFTDWCKTLASIVDTIPLCCDVWLAVMMLLRDLAEFLNKQRVVNSIFQSPIISIFELYLKFGLESSIRYQSMLICCFTP
jgi:hypothetical protein